MIFSQWWGLRDRQTRFLAFQRAISGATRIGDFGQLVEGDPHRPTNGRA